MLVCPGKSTPSKCVIGNKLCSSQTVQVCEFTSLKCRYSRTKLDITTEHGFGSKLHAQHSMCLMALEDYSLTTENMYLQQTLL